MDRVNDLAFKSVAVIFTKSTCFMCHSIKALFYDFGASPVVYEVDHDVDLECALWSLGSNIVFPAVFVGGKYLGSAKEVISLQIDDTLKRKLIEPKAIWL
ncbi:putative glutaredoxin, Thioredoxin-like superfamily [Helianthus annuus]|nr:putative glutaredoxin, Thioredoxin-like superfamily [Helianthus annuus]